MGLAGWQQLVATDADARLCPQALRALRDHASNGARTGCRTAGSTGKPGGLVSAGRGGAFTATWDSGRIELRHTSDAPHHALRCAGRAD